MPSGADNVKATRSCALRLVSSQPPLRGLAYRTAAAREAMGYWLIGSAAFAMVLFACSILSHSGRSAFLAAAALTISAAALTLPSPAPAAPRLRLVPQGRDRDLLTIDSRPSGRSSQTRLACHFQ